MAKHSFGWGLLSFFVVALALEAGIELLALRESLATGQGLLAQNILAAAQILIAGTVAGFVGGRRVLMPLAAVIVVAFLFVLYSLGQLSLDAPSWPELGAANLDGFLLSMLCMVMGVTGGAQIRAKSTR